MAWVRVTLYAPKRLWKNVQLWAVTLLHLWRDAISKWWSWPFHKRQPVSPRPPQLCLYSPGLCPQHGSRCHYPLRALSFTVPRGLWILHMWILGTCTREKNPAWFRNSTTVKPQYIVSIFQGFYISECSRKTKITF